MVTKFNDFLQIDHNSKIREGILPSEKKVFRCTEFWNLYFRSFVAGWSSLVARQAHNLKVAGSNPAPAPKINHQPKFKKKIISPVQSFRAGFEPTIIMNVSVKDLLDAGVHFGHQVRRWNPKSKPFVYDNRHGISIINLEKTYDLLENAAQAIEEIVASGKQVLLVGTKRQAIEPIRELAAATSMPFCVNRWMGGTLTNYETVSNSIAKYKKYLRMEEDGSLDKMHGKESAAIKRQMTRMNRDFEGLLNLQGLPGALFVIDSFNEEIAVAEANRLKIPVIALVDSNSDPSVLSHPIPGNDDSTKSIRIIVDVILDAIQSGSSKRVQTPTKRKDITPVAQEPDFLENEDEPEVTLPEGYEESDFDDRKKVEQTDEAKDAETVAQAEPIEESPSDENEEDSESSESPEENPATEEAKS